MKNSAAKPKPEVTAKFAINDLLPVNKENLSNIYLVKQVEKMYQLEKF